MAKDGFSFEIIEHIGVIDEYKSGYKKELNIVSWNGGEPKYDIRDWDEEHKHMTRGITLKPVEMDKVVNLVWERGRNKSDES